MDWLLAAAAGDLAPACVARRAPAAAGRATASPSRSTPLGADERGPLPPRDAGARRQSAAGRDRRRPWRPRSRRRLAASRDGREKDVTLALALAIRDALAATGRVRVALTREDDRYLVLEDRYEIARRLDADLFISIHADAAPANDGARGATIYTLSEVASDREAALLAAARERGRPDRRRAAQRATPTST